MELSAANLIQFFMMIVLALIGFVNKMIWAQVREFKEHQAAEGAARVRDASRITKLEVRADSNDGVLDSLRLDVRTLTKTAGNLSVAVAELAAKTSE